jgi:hypothetical protein
MAMVSLGQAARLAGLGKTTLARAIKAGRLSATRRDDGGYQIDVAELERVYPLRAPAEAADGTGAAPGLAAHQATDHATSAALAAEVAALREMLTMMREQAAELRHDRDEWRDQAQRFAALPAPATPATPEKPMTWWRWLRSTG